MHVVVKVKVFKGIIFNKKMCLPYKDCVAKIGHVFFSQGGATFILAPRIGICYGTLEMVPQEVLWSIWGSHQTV